MTPDLAARCRALPVFPLPEVVLMPSVTLPLHVFEPRYRALVADALGADGLFAIGTIRPGAELDPCPALWPEVGLGRVVRHERLPDGRSNLLLAEVASARLVRELTTAAPYRLFEAELVPAGEPPEVELAGVRAMVRQLGAVATDAGEEAVRLASLPGMQLANALARRMFLEPDRQRAYLGLPDRSRVHQVADGLAELLGSMPPIGDA